MDRGDVGQAIRSLLRKYRLAALVLAAGLLLMCIPEKQEQLQECPVEESGQQTLQEGLENLLSGLEGAGKVKVLLSISTGSQHYYQSDEELQSNEVSREQRKDTVIITSADRQQQGLLLRTDPPVYLGAVVLCQGADSPRVKLAVVDAVSTVTGLGADQISVLKMK